MKLTEVIAVWDILHVKQTGELGYCDLEEAIEKVVGIENDVPGFSKNELLMFLSGPQPKRLETGDQGQCYEIRGRRREGGTIDVIGWTDNDPQGLVDATKAWPRYVDAWFVDRRISYEKNLPG